MKYAIASLLAIVLAIQSASFAAAQPSVQQLIDEAIKTDQRQLTIPPGEYRVAPANEVGPHVTIRNAKDLAIDATGVTLICTTANQALRIEGSANVTIKGLAIDYDPLPFTQGTIVSMADDGASFQVKLHAGYPPVTGRIRGIVMDENTRVVKADTWTRFAGTATDAADGLINADWGRPIRDTAKVGDFIVLTGQSKSPHGIYLTNCSGMVLDSVSVHASTSFAILEVGGDGGNTYRNVRIVPGPTPAGATEARLLASNADGIHSKHTNRGPTIEGCEMNATGDDGIAINGDFAMVVRSESETSAIIAPTRQLSFRVGDRVRGFDERLVPTDYVTITAITKIDPTGENDPRPVQQRRLPELRHSEHLLKDTYQFTFDGPLKLAAGYLMSSPDRNGSGFAVRNNTIRNHRARGILIKASEGVVENNTVEGSSIAGIVLAPEPEYWLEADYSRDVLVRNNVLRKVGHGARNAGSIQAGAISVVADSKGAADGHRNITIENNTIEDAAGCNVIIMSAKGVTVTGNRFVRPGHAAIGAGTKFGVDGSAMIWIDHAQDVVLEDNVATDVGPQTTKPVVITESAMNVRTDSK